MLNAVYGNVAYDGVFTVVGVVLLGSVLLVRHMMLRRRRPTQQRPEPRCVHTYMWYLLILNRCMCNIYL
jgi:hypothetical protein